MAHHPRWSPGSSGFRRGLELRAAVVSNPTLPPAGSRATDFAFWPAPFEYPERPQRRYLYDGHGIAWVGNRCLIGRCVRRGWTALNQRATHRVPGHWPERSDGRGGDARPDSGDANAQRLVPVRMRVPRPRQHRRAVGVLVMCGRAHARALLQWLVRVPVLVPLRQVQPDAGGHQDRQPRSGVVSGSRGAPRRSSRPENGAVEK